MLLMIPILLSMYIRIYRVKRVFELYEKFLDRMAVRSSSVFSTFGMVSSTMTPFKQNTSLAQEPIGAPNSPESQQKNIFDLGDVREDKPENRQTIPNHSSGIMSDS